MPPNDVPAPRLPTARGALRRSLVVWGWGQIATHDRRGWLLVPLEPIVLGALVGLGVPLAAGTAVDWVFLAGAVVLIVWSGQAVHAYRRAAQRRRPFGLSGGDGGAIEVLWLAPLAIVAATVFWAVAGRGASADTTLARYVADWSAANATDGAALFAEPLDSGVLADAWTREQPRLRNALVLAAATAGANGGIDPDEPFDAVRWEADPAMPDGRLVVHARLARQETVRDTFFGLVPTTRQRLVPIGELGSVTLRLVTVPGPVGGQPSVDVWRIQAVDLLDDHVTGS